MLPIAMCGRIRENQSSQTLRFPTKNCRLALAGGGRLTLPS
jgi:hypothetical protein